MKTYDIINAGPNNRFMANGRIVSNSGRLIQLQNLPQNHLPDLAEARSVVKSGDYELMNMLYDDVPDTLSQLIRTAFVPREGYKFVVADFSSIEARVLSYLAKEQWRIEAFAEGKDIYCASASQMFGVPVEKHGVNSELRAKGKIAELALGYGGSVGALKAMGALDMELTEPELQPLVDYWRSSNPHIVQFWWDVDRAILEAVKRHTSTETHGLRFIYQSGMLFIALPSGRRLAYVKPRIGENQFGGECVTYEGIGIGKKWERISSYGPKFVENCLAGDTPVLTDKGLIPIANVTKGEKVWDGKDWVSHDGLIDQGIRETIRLGQLRMTPDHKILTEKGWVSCGEAEGLNWAPVSLPDNFAAALRNTSAASGNIHKNEYLCIKQFDGKNFPVNSIHDDSISVHATRFSEHVYDLKNCGPRHRFAVYDRGTGELRIVSNCVQAISRDILAYAMKTLRSCFIVGHVHDELIIECSKGVSVDAICEQMSRTPPWIPGLQLRADGYECEFYQKD